MAPAPAASGDGSVSAQRLTPTTTCSPNSTLRSRSVLLSTSARFIQSMAATTPPIASMRASSAFAASFSSSTLRRTAVEPSNRSGYSRRSVS